MPCFTLNGQYEDLLENLMKNSSQDIFQKVVEEAKEVAEGLLD